MIIASAQFYPTKCSVDANLDWHYKFVETAAQKNVELLIFPEMSITGYIHEEAKLLAFKASDNRLETLSQLAMEYNITIVAGAPLLEDDHLYIASFILNTNGSTNIYRKRFLHGNEVKYFRSGIRQDVTKYEIGGEKVALAICADITYQQHAEEAAMVQPDLYAASIYFSENGIAEAYEKLGTYAQNFKFGVLMSNFSIGVIDSKPAGKSAYWNSEGKLIGSLSNETGLLVIDTEKDSCIKMSFF